MTGRWTLDSWRNRPAAQMPIYPERAIPDARRPLTPPDARMELSHLDPFTLVDSGDYPPLVVVNRVCTLKSHCAVAKRRSRTSSHETQ
jgi:hypothetical protein